MAIVTLILGLLVTRTGATRTGELSLDQTIAEHRIPLLTVVAQSVNVILGPTIAPILLLIATIVIWRRHRTGALTWATLTLAGWLSVELGKALVHRPRPSANLVNALASETAADSYPSGHTAFIAAAVFAGAVTLTLSYRSTRTLWPIGAALIIVTGASRLYLGVHYLTDVIASVLFAAATTIALTPLLRDRLWPVNPDSPLVDRRREPPS